MTSKSPINLADLTGKLCVKPDSKALERTDG